MITFAAVDIQHAVVTEVPSEDSEVLKGHQVVDEQHIIRQTAVLKLPATPVTQMECDRKASLQQLGSSTISTRFQPAADINAALGCTILPLQNAVQVREVPVMLQHAQNKCGMCNTAKYLSSLCMSLLFAQYASEAQT